MSGRDLAPSPLFPLPLPRHSFSAAAAVNVKVSGGSGGGYLIFLEKSMCKFEGNSTMKFNGPLKTFSALIFQGFPTFVVEVLWGGSEDDDTGRWQLRRGVSLGGEKG